MLRDELVRYIFAGAAPALGERCAGWMASSPRYKAFVESHRDKIRKKVRGIGEAEGLRDLELELDTAYRLLQDRRLSVEYEKYLADKARGPDFTVSYTTRLTFNLEVKRLRMSGHFGKWADVVCGKLGQLRPSSINLLLIASDHAAGAGLEAAEAMARLRALAERKDEEFFTRRGLAGARDYLRQSLRLSGVLTRSAWDDEDATRTTLWTNAQARHPIPAAVRTVLT